MTMNSKQSRPDPLDDDRQLDEQHDQPGDEPPGSVRGQKTVRKTARKTAKQRTLSFEQALEQLEETVALLERGDLTLSESLARYEQGVRCLKRCYEQLELAEHRVQLLSGVDAQGKEILEPFDEPDEDLPQKAASRSARRTHKKKPPTASGSGPA